MTAGWHKVVLHVHTNHSYDANATCADVLATARRQGVHCVAITDHDEIAGALECRELARRDGTTAGHEELQVIVGEEVSTRDGHLIGLFLDEYIPPGLSAEETATRMRAQGGVVLAPHPATWLCDNSLSYATLARLAPLLDGVEVCNAQNPLVWEDTRAWRFVRRYGVTPYVGADAHVRGHLAACYQVMPAFRTPAEFKVSLQQAQLFPGRFPPAYFAWASLWHLWDRLHLPPLAGCGAEYYRSRNIGARGVEIAER